MFIKFLTTICLCTIPLLPCQETATDTKSPAVPPTESPLSSVLPSSMKSSTDSVAEPPTDPAVESPPEPKSQPVVDEEKQSIKIEHPWKRLGKNQIWINQTTKQVMVRGSICLRKGALEMFACPLQTKEHESIIAVEAQSSEIHATLVALGFEPGNPVQWQPEHKPVSGPKIKIEVRWHTETGEKTADAKSFVRKSGTAETLDTDWVFGGSTIFIDRVDGRQIYYADSGEMICLSNFPTAMMDVPIQSSDSADGLIFEANTEVIPATNTQVYLIITPRR